MRSFLESMAVDEEEESWVDIYLTEMHRLLRFERYFDNL
jgi:hypothetical protein